MPLLGRSNSGSSIGNVGLSAGSDFTIVESPKKQTVCLIFGVGGTGKTTFVTEYAPHPAAFINFDMRANHALEKAAQQGRRILYTHVGIPANIAKMETDAAKRIGQQATDKFFRNFEWAVRESQKGNVKTIGIDTGTELGELFNLAIKGRPGGKDKDYGQAKDWTNQQWLQMFKTAREGNAHLVVLARAKSVFETTYFTYRGPEVMFDTVDWAGQIRLTEKVGISKPLGGGLVGSGKKKDKKAPDFELEIVKAGVSIEEFGEVYSSRDWGEMGPFVYACLQQYPGSLPEDWQ